MRLLTEKKPSENEQSFTRLVKNQKITLKFLPSIAKLLNLFSNVSGVALCTQYQIKVLATVPKSPKMVIERSANARFIDTPTPTPPQMQQANRLSL